VSSAKREVPLAQRLRERAAAFNDAGLRYGVADLLVEAAERVEFVELQEAGLREDVARLDAVDDWRKRHAEHAGRAPLSELDIIVNGEVD
jgi:hypothetical protein